MFTHILQRIHADALEYAHSHTDLHACKTMPKHYFRLCIDKHSHTLLHLPEDTVVVFCSHHSPWWPVASMMLVFLSYLSLSRSCLRVCVCWTSVQMHMWLKIMLVDLISTLCVCVRVCVYMCVLFVSEMFFRPVDDTGSVWVRSSPLFLLAYISSINPVLGGLLWSLRVLWAMVIICLLCSRCFMRLFCSLPPLHPSFSLLFTLYPAHSHCLCLFLVLHIHVHYISLPYFLLLLYNTSFWSTLL